MSRLARADSPEGATTSPIRSTAGSPDSLQRYAERRAWIWSSFKGHLALDRGGTPALRGHDVQGRMPGAPSHVGGQGAQAPYRLPVERPHRLGNGALVRIQDDASGVVMAGQ